MVYSFLNYYALQVYTRDPQCHVEWKADLVRLVCTGLLRKSNWKESQIFPPGCNSSELSAQIWTMCQNHVVLNTLARTLRWMRCTSTTSKKEACDALLASFHPF